MKGSPGALPDSLALSYFRRRIQALSIRLVTHIYRLQESGAVKEAEALMSLLGIKTSTKKRKKRLSSNRCTDRILA